MNRGYYYATWQKDGDHTAEHFFIYKKAAVRWSHVIQIYAAT